MDAQVRAGSMMRRWLPTAVTVAVLLGAAGTALAMTAPDEGDRRITPSSAAPAPAFPAPGTPPAPSAGPPPGPAPAAAGPDLDEVLHLPGAPPAKGSGGFAYAAGRGRVLGTAGALRLFRVGVEKGSGEDADAFAAAVEATLGDDRSWTGGGTLRLQRVPDGARHDFTVYLATRTTAGRMCAAGGTNITVGGKPYTSCRATGKVIINLDRWRLSSPRFTELKVPLGVYRQYVVNHEVGHELGHAHQGCPGDGKPAPVMMQQTLKLLGCRPHAWPRRNGSNWTGPRI